ncbi:MAG: sodium:proton antiporter [Lacunisphaera sp.]|nr:sodium:proton antiporter [Lacunisphaera sp.]
MIAAIQLAVMMSADISPVLLIPFGLLLLLIAIMPLSPERLRHLWEHYYPHVAVTLGLLVAGLYWFGVAEGRSVVGHTLHEYFSFISLIGSLFVVAGGIHLRIRSEGTPRGNVAFLAAGAVLANVIGTTGASMLLIRPWMRINRHRLGAYHVVFFIFIVSNCGGALTPIGDPPLFLGYLRGVPFFWLLGHAWEPWLLVNGLILAVFYVFDRRRAAQSPSRLAEAGAGALVRIGGTVNLGLLAAVVVGVFLPERYFIREWVMLGAALVSYRLTPRAVHQENQFNFAPIREVAWLFFGIFLTMMPALGYLETHGPRVGLTKPAQYYYATGALSAVLDNAPTYVNFLKLAEVTFVSRTPDENGADVGDYDRRAVRQLLATAPDFVVAISLGAVFFGALTYIGNGPNFMVKGIAENSGVKMPGFFGYLFKYSLPVLLPVLVIAAWVFV